MAVRYETVVPWGRAFEEYLDKISLDFHFKAIEEMLRVVRW